jgi:hypothetical protein
MKIINVLFALIIAVGLFLPFNYPVKADTLDILVAASTDDVSAYGTGAISDGLTYLSMGLSGTTQSVGMRFRGVTIPNGAVVSTAYIIFTAYEDDSADTVRIKLSAEQSETAATFSTYADFTGRTLTTAQVDWDFTTNWATGLAYNSGEIKTVIQELVNDYAGLSSADIVLFAKDDGSDVGARRLSKSYDLTTTACPKLHIEYTIPSCALTGTVTTALETDIVTGGKVITLTLTDDTWVAAGGVFDAIRDDIISGMDSAQSEAGGWDAQYKANAAAYVANVVRTSGTVVTVTMSALAGYVITANETITVTIPAAAVTSGLAIVASPTFTITNISVTTVTTQAVSAVAVTTATGNGNVTDDGGSTITERGTVIAVTANPTTADTKDTSAGTTGAFTTTIAALTKGTTYHVRAYAINAIGTSYGADVEFTTIDDPTISTIAASLITSATARLNSQVTFDGVTGGGEACTVTFVYAAGSPYADYAAVLGAAGSVEVAAAGTWTAGQFPNYDVAGLTVGTLYSFAVKVVNSTTTVAYGSVLTFTTSTGISDASTLTAIPTATTVSLAWVKGLGSGYTLVRYSASGYPATTADGTFAYLGVGNSYMLTGLTPGTSYYFSAWGKTGALYSAGYVTAMATTLAFDTAVSTGAIEAPPTNSWWNQTPSTTKVSSIPMISGLVSANATAYAIPEASLWYFLWVLFSVGIGVFIYSKSGNNLPMSLGAQALLFALGAVLGLVMLWIMVLFMIIGAGFSLWGDRR